MRQERSVHVAVSPERAFAFADESDNAPRWAEGIVAIRMIEERPGQVGSRFEVDIKEGPKVNTYAGVLLVYEPPQRKRSRLSRDGFIMEMQLDFEPEGGGTRITQRVEYEVKGAMMLLFPLLWTMTRVSLAKQTGKLKELLEQA